MITVEDLKNISISIEDYGGGWYDRQLYYKGKLIATYTCNSHNRLVIDEKNLKELELEERLTNELKEFYPIDMLSEEDRNKAKEIAKNKYGLDAVKFIHEKMPQEGLKGAKAYFDLYIDEEK